RKHGGAVPILATGPPKTDRSDLFELREIAIEARPKLVCRTDKLDADSALRRDVDNESEHRERRFIVRVCEIKLDHNSVRRERLEPHERPGLADVRDMPV